MSARPSSPPLTLQPPSDRDHTIYLLHKAHRVKQKQLAHDYDLSAGRVSQIVKEVREWLANASARQGELDHNQERRLERRIERERLEHLYGQSLQMLEDFEKPAESTRGEGEDAVKTTREERNARVQALKSCTRLAESLGRIAEREPLPPPPAEETYIHRHRLYTELQHQREEAEERATVPTSGDSRQLVGSLLNALVGRQIYPLPTPGSPLAAAVLKIAEALAAAAGGCVVATTTPSAASGPASDPLGLAAAAEPSHPGDSHAEADPAAKETKLAGYTLLDGCDPDTLRMIVASGWLERFKDGGPMHRESLLAASLARENSEDFSADEESQVQSPKSKVAEGGCVVAATTPSVAGENAGDPLCYAAAAKHSHRETASHPPHEPAPRGIDVVGSPEWKVARAKWLKERDERVAAERLQKIQARIERDEDLRQRRAAAAARRRWLEAGQCQY